MEATKFVPLKPEITERISKTIQTDCETSQWVGETFEIQEGKTDNGKSKKKSKYLLVTEACLNIVDKSFEKPNRLFSFFDILSITNNTDYVTIQFSKKTYQFVVADPLAFITAILSQVKKLSYQINPTRFADICPIAKSPDYENQPEPTKRPHYLLATRYISLCISKELKPEPNIIQTFKNYDHEPKNFIRLSNENHLTSSSTIILALGLEPFIKNVILDNFASNTLDEILNFIISDECSFQSLDLWRYEQAPTLHDVNNYRSPFNQLKTIRFHYCSSACINSFLDYIQGVNYKIDTLLLDNVQFESECAEKFIQLLSSSTFLSSLTSLGFLTCSSQTPFFAFAQSCIQSCRQLLNFTCENCEIDVCSMLVEIMKNQLTEIDNDDDNQPDDRKFVTKLQRVSLRSNKAEMAVSYDETIIADSFLILDVGDVEWTTEALISFISAICHRFRRSPLALIMDKATISTEWSELFERLPIENYVSNIAELNISYNEFDTKAFELFLKFLDTQSPLLSTSKTKLMHLNISHCLQENMAECMKKLIDFLVKRELWGLEICGCQPTASLLNIAGLYALNIGDNEFDKDSIKSLMTIINDSANLTEIGLNNIKFPDVKTMMQFFTNALGVSKILAYEPLTTFYNEYSTFTETQNFKHFLAKKRQFSTTSQRISLFLTLAGDFETRLAPPFVFTDTEETLKEISKKALLDSIKISNPPPSLLTLASHTSNHGDLDPLALMFADYVEADAKFGVLPPTAPPLDKPQSEFMLPSIFATMNTRNEVDGNDDFTDFDPLSEENQKLSEKLAIALRTNSKPLRIGGNREFWNDPKSQTVFKTIDPQSK